MPIYNYKATDTGGRTVSGKLDALDEREVVVYLRQQRLTPVRIRPSWRDIELGSGRIKTKQLTAMIRMFATLLKASVPVTAALTALYKQAETTPMRRMLRRLLVDVESGDTFATAVRKQNDVFDSIMANMVAAGEGSGNLDAMLERMAIMLERNQAIQGKIKGALVFPVIVLIMAFIGVGVLLVFVLPQFVAMFEASKVPLPLPTRITLAASAIFKNYWWAMIASFFGLFQLGKRALQVPSIRERRDRIALKMPIFGTLVRKAAIARFGRTFGTLMASGVNIIESLQLVEGTTGNVVLTAAINRIRQTLTAGGEMGKAMDETGVFPPMVVSMVSIGEQTANLDQMLDKVADYYEDEVNRGVDGAIKLIEPLMLVFVGAIIAVILLSIYLPMFSMLSVMTGGT